MSIPVIKIHLMSFLDSLSDNFFHEQCFKNQSGALFYGILHFDASLIKRCFPSLRGLTFKIKMRCLMVDK